MAVARNKCYLPTGDTIQDIITAAGGIYICTSTTRPSNPTDGMHIYESDTKKTLKWNGTGWTDVGGGFTNPATADLNMNGNKITNVTELTSPAATNMTFTIPAGKLFVFRKV